MTHKTVVMEINIDEKLRKKLKEMNYPSHLILSDETESTAYSGKF